MSTQKHTFLLLLLCFLATNSLLAQKGSYHTNDSLVETYDTVFETQHFVFHFIKTADLNVEALVQKMEGNIDKIESFTESPLSGKKLILFIYPDIEQKGLKYKNTMPAEVDFVKKYAFLVVNDVFKGEQSYVVNQLILSQLLPKPKLEMLEAGLSVYFTESWQRKGYFYWAGRLFVSRNMPSVSELLDNDLFEKESPLVMECTAALYVEFLIQHFGKKVFLEKYSHWTAEDLQKTKGSWQSFLMEKYANFSESKKEWTVPQLKGFNFAHEGFNISDGYGSRLAKESLVKMTSLGANAVALVPYTFMDAPKKAQFLTFRSHAGAETDESIIVTNFEAKKLGAFTILKPQIHIEDSWPGAIDMSSEEEWALFFDYYYRWIRHYALLAEMNEIDMLSVGVELSIASRNHPEEWRKLIKKLRGIYSGPMTYSANWWREYANISFWDALDFMGLDCYYPLGHYPKVKKKELQSVFKKTLKKVNKTRKRFGLPLLITEIGFRSVEATWMKPFDAPLGRKFDDEAQQLCYEVIFEGLAEVDWCQGILWWKWPSYLTYKGENNSSFSPVGKVTEQVIRKYFNAGK